MIAEIIRKFKTRLIGATIFSALGSFASVSILAVVSDSVNASSFAEVQGKIPMFIGAVLLLFFIGLLSQWMLSKLGISLVYELRRVLLRRVLNADYENLERIGGHRVHATVTTDVGSIAQGLGVLPVFAVNVATVVCCSVYLTYLSWQLFLVVFFGMGSGIVLAMWIMQRGRKHFARLREESDELFNAFKTMVDGSKELSINKNRSRFFFNSQAIPSAENVRDIEYRAQFYWVLSDNFGKTVLFAVLGLVVFSWYLFEGIDKAVLTSFILFTTYLVGPLGFIMSAFQALTRGKIAYSKILNLQLTNDNENTKDDIAPATKDWKSIQVKDACYSYQHTAGSSFSVGPLNMEIKQGEILFIRGGNGSGKSTFAKVLVGLYQPQEGSLSFASQEITSANLQWYRRHFSTVFSDFYLFEHVLDAQGNLVQKEDLQAHLEKLELAHKVDVVDGKFSAINLSQGQRKRLAMLLAYAEDAQIYLFDEWAADQDPVFRHYFYTELLPELKSKGKTVVAITHDEKYFHCADRICQFDAGSAVFEPVPSE